MRILFALHDIQDLGGIINHTEQLALGFIELGHECDIVQIVNREAVQSRKLKREQGSANSVFGIQFDQRRGWAWNPEQRFPMKSTRSRTNWVKKVDRYDLVIWEVALPPLKRNGYRPNWEWLYSHSTPQIVIVHDGNFLRANCELVNYRHRVDFVAVHTCASRTLKEAGVEHTMIVNPNGPRKPLGIPWSRRKRVVGSLQTFKMWKRVDDYVRAVPHIDAHCWLAGGGIEYHYMTSPEKTRPEYEGIWESAIQHGMEYTGYLNAKDRDIYLSKSRLLVDASFSKYYAQRGAHFNRVLVDAMWMDCVPMAYKSMTECGWFKAWKNYIPIEGSLKDAVNDALINHEAANKIIEYNRKLRKRFERKRVAKQYLELIQ